MSHSKNKPKVEEEEAFLEQIPLHDDVAWPRERRSCKPTRYLRLTLEIAMAAAIIILLVTLIHSRVEERRSPVPKFPRKTYTFLPNPQYIQENMLFDEHATLHTLHNWIPLSADARGYIHLPTYTSYPTLPPPFTVAINRTSEGPAYMMSVFHQLHCLSYLISHFQAGYGGVKLEEEVAHHSAHCFDYIRQSIMCAADTNLEGETEAGPGWGSPHECVDYDAVLAWANEHGAERWRNGLLPGESIL
ncbi:uncharacterized protein GGS22DRAFT_183520 [Annulohypoxylon maeteangense]|uniref:uncharacterized protein n=1 Tax=Annulohypoxylon maeteangense TaxID=1927788 RepID=UPI002008D725|nr:uncharacterized protein GGS22DRAFT_183520 [Annulohypoxylon maeteangense]KAI0890173.1 hypothetical protein GGS22DRAFT_183520 [Annulohypoxylon maeteangense]